MTKSNTILFKILKLLILLLLLIAIIFGAIYFWTPSSARFPEYDHSHFRMQYIFQGQAEDFATPRYQVEYSKDSCTGELPKEPIHFHDNRNHFVHLHWQRMTGGQVLKYYGLNKIDFVDSYMGIRIDELLKFKFNPMPIHANSLPKPRSDDKFFVYNGKAGEYKSRDINEFVTQDLEKFFGVESTIRKTLEEDKAKKVNWLEPTALAHNGETHANQTEEEKHEKEVKEAEKLKAEVESRNNISQNSTTTIQPNKTDEELKDINNLLGDVLIFVQKDEPTADQINQRFNAMVPLSPSSCGG